MHDTSVRLADITGQHCFEGSEDFGRCTACGVTVWRRHTPPREPGPRTWLEWLALDGRGWNSSPAAPSCPPQEVEAACPWEENARRYGGVWGDVQHETAMRTWCKTHQMAVADCPEPGPYCPGQTHHEQTSEKGQPGPCTGRENSCKCMCPACCGDTPDVWGYEGDC